MLGHETNGSKFDLTMYSPIKFNLKGFQKSTGDVDDVHQTAHAARIDVAEVVVSEQDLPHIVD